jgi:hypothetical protein
LRDVRLEVARSIAALVNCLSPGTVRVLSTQLQQEEVTPGRQGRRNVYPAERLACWQMWSSNAVKPAGAFS